MASVSLDWRRYIFFRTVQLILTDLSLLATSFFEGALSRDKQVVTNGGWFKNMFLFVSWGVLFCGHCGFSSLRGSCSFFGLCFYSGLSWCCLLYLYVVCWLCLQCCGRHIVDKNNRMTRKSICQIKQGARRTMTIVATMTRTITIKDNHENNNSNNSNSTTKSLSLVMSIIIKTQNQKKQKAKQWWLRVLGATPP